MTGDQAPISPSQDQEIRELLRERKGGSRIIRLQMQALRQIAGMRFRSEDPRAVFEAMQQIALDVIEETEHDL